MKETPSQNSGTGREWKKSIPIVREREYEAFILGNGREREFPLTPGLNLNILYYKSKKFWCMTLCIKINWSKNKHLFHLAKLLGVHTKYRKNIKSVVFGQRVAFSSLYYSFKRWKFKKLSMKCIVCGTRMHF